MSSGDRLVDTEQASAPDEDRMRVAIVAESQFSRLGLRSVLRRAPDIELVAEAADAERAVEQAVECSPDVVLIEALGNRAEVLGLVQHIVRKCYPASPAILLLASAHDPDMAETLWVGACGIVLVQADGEQLVHAIRLASAGYFVIAPAFAGDAHQRCLPKLLIGRESRPPCRLSNRETEVLRLVASGFRNAEISAALSVSDNTVKSHIGRMLHKLGLPNRCRLIIYAYESGLVPVDGR
ncbi:response regulator transcription factor [Actinomadura sp. HBU206391]|uniref:response regulator transcription factor n=1 Tax=Actinomadura sp. HBU206391 TaxID=2731692 RepID=UPI0016505D97|nr:response regulator transcription factor [Actinomadura sp. HBU206391]MBC6456900.1 response regulator transcription factor [Actinomadura sp. HBU206391]